MLFSSICLQVFFCLSLVFRSLIMMGLGWFSSSSSCLVFEIFVSVNLYFFQISEFLSNIFLFYLCYLSFQYFDDFMSHLLLLSHRSLRFYLLFVLNLFSDLQIYQITPSHPHSATEPTQWFYSSVISSSVLKFFLFIFFISVLRTVFPLQVLLSFPYGA